MLRAPTLYTLAAIGAHGHGEHHHGGEKPVGLGEDPEIESKKQVDTGPGVTSP